MRSRNLVPRDRLLTVLARLGPISAPALAEALDVPGRTVLRVLDEQSSALVVAGAARRRRYAARRGLRGDTGGLPLYRIDRSGHTHDAGVLHLVAPQGTWWSLDGGPWPCPAEARDGWWSGLPYPLQDMRVQGYMGRQFARRHHEVLGLSVDPRDWTDDDQLVALSQAGHDTPGDLVVGDVSLRRWQAQHTQDDVIAEPDCAPTYARLATEAVATGVAGSSAAGEFPKFTARRALAGASTTEVIVKFSGADDSPAVRRWADLLQCEALALAAVATLPGVAAARCRVLRHGGRVFLESERFDRHGPRGHSAVVSLAALDAVVLGQGHSDWPRLAQALAERQWLDAADVSRVAQVHWFGRLIANTDMHNGNLSFRPEGGRLLLAPVYDMLPMRVAPLAGGEVPPLAPIDWRHPRPDQASDWRLAAAAAVAFWRSVAGSSGIGAPMRKWAQACATQGAAALRAVTAPSAPTPGRRSGTA